METIWCSFQLRKRKRENPEIDPLMLSKEENIATTQNNVKKVQIEILAEILHKHASKKTIVSCMNCKTTLKFLHLTTILMARMNAFASIKLLQLCLIQTILNFKSA
jgi:hypothetical protein